MAAEMRPSPHLQAKKGRRLLARRATRHRKPTPRIRSRMESISLKHRARPRFAGGTGTAATLAFEIAQLPAQILRDESVHPQIDGGSVFQLGGDIIGRGINFLHADDLVDI